MRDCKWLSLDPGSNVFDEPDTFSGPCAQALYKGMTIGSCFLQRASLPPLSPPGITTPLSLLDAAQSPIFLSLPFIIRIIS
jgi:hypothetical protein